MYSSDYLYTQLLALRHSNITPITLDDYSLYQEYFQREPRMDAYADTFTYITQSCRGFGLGMKYLSDTQLFSIGCHQNHFVVVRPIGLLDDSFMGLLNQLYHLSEKPVFLKKIFDDQLDSLLKLGNFEWVMHKNEDGSLSYGNTIWSIDCPADDDTYPELIYTGDLLQQSSKRIDEWASYFVTRRANNLNGVSLKSYKDDMGKVRKWMRRAKKNHQEPRIERVSPASTESILHFLETYFYGQEDYLEAHINSLQIPPQAEVGNYFQLVSFMPEKSEPIAYHVGERTGKESASFTIGVTSKEYTGLGLFIYYYIFDFLRPYGINRINVGGSETASLHRFKRSIPPIEEKTMNMLVYNPSPKVSEGVSTGSLA